ncbi:MAG: hypothetical protein BWY74_00767 [Firmicutes bacterium ADurb.Bin419]|nr:MAG: hypothetical protein BWY74_00767 [Firmicutes bacterium ADurb.Bin419]
MQIVRVLSGPIVGAIIGLFTNYIAVKMLFRPKNAIKIGKFTLPFTPGIIPKRKADLAKAVGRTVGNVLFGENEVMSIIASEEMKNTFVYEIMKNINERVSEDTTAKSMLSEIMGEDIYSQKRDELSHKIADRIVYGLLNMDVGKVITDRGVEVLRQKLSNPMLSFLVNEKTINYIAVPIGEQINEYIKTDGIDKIESFLSSEVSELENRQIYSMFSDKEAVMLKMQNKLGDLYINFINRNVESFVKRFRISEIVEEKITSMSNESMEALVLSVMKTELNMVVNLGAVIGFAIGIINIFI